GVEMWVREYFANCWRGHETIWTTFLSSVIVFWAWNFPMYLLEQHAKANWPGSQFVISILALAGALCVVTYFTVSMWRASRSSFLRGARFWPIVGSFAAAALPAMFALGFVTKFFDAFPR